MSRWSSSNLVELAVPNEQLRQAKQNPDQEPEESVQDVILVRLEATIGKG
jgi:hypothetical protein